MMVWNVVLSTLLAVLGWILKEKSDELQRLQVLLNRTREEVARDNVTQQELDKIVTHIDARFDKLADKLDMILKEQRSALN
jgi:hypothetical protein